MPIIVSRGGTNAQKIDETGVAGEDYLQQYIAENPDALPIGDIKDPDALPIGDIEDDVRLMIVGCEFKTRNDKTLKEWMDVLAVDGNGHLYLIETKLFKNTTKRHVIAQVLDYGAALWRKYSDPSTFLPDLDRFMTSKTGKGLDESITEFFGYDDEQLREIRDRMQARIQGGSFRFVIVMDKLSEPLKDLIQFMNERTSFDIYAVEMEFYRHDELELEIVIPKLFDVQVEKSISGGGGRAQGRPWDEDRFFKALEDKCSNGAIEVAKELLSWVKANADNVWWGKGNQDGSFGAAYCVGDLNLNGFLVWTSGTVQIFLGDLAKTPPFQEEPKRLELLGKLNAIEGIGPPLDDFSKYPHIKLEVFSSLERRTQFIEVLDWLVNEIRNKD